MKNITLSIIKQIIQEYNLTLEHGALSAMGHIRFSRKQTGDYELMRYYENVFDANPESLENWISFLRELFGKHGIKFAVIGTRTGWDQRNYSYDSVSLYVKFHH